METDYNKQAQDFLTQTNTTLTIQKATEQNPPIWHKKGEKHGIKYICTLSNNRHTYTFDFWNSIADYEKMELAKKAKITGVDSPEWFAIKDWCNKKASATVPSIIKDNKPAPEYTQKAFISKAVLNNIVDTVDMLIQPKASDVLACLSPLYEDTLEDFCDSFGYDHDSRLAEKTFEACREQDRNLRKLFTHEEIEKLVEIQ